MSKPDTHVVLVRPLATNKWKPIAYAKSIQSAIKLAQKPRKSLRHGDLILAMDLAEVSAIPERGKCLYFVDKAGAITKAPRIRPYINQPTWFLGWEGPEASAADMLYSCGNVERKLLVQIACYASRMVLSYIKDGDNRPRIVIEMAEALMHGESTPEDLTEAIDSARSDIMKFDPYEAWVAVISAGYSAIPNGHSHSNAASTIEDVAETLPGDSMANLRELSHLVRQYIPLHVVLESL